MSGSQAARSHLMLGGSLRRNSQSLTSGRGATEMEEQEVAGIEVERVAFLNTALCALPGTALRTFFAPIMNVKCSLFRRRHLTKQHVLSDETKMHKMFQESIRILAKALSDASTELFDTPMTLREDELAAALKGKLTPVCYEPGAVLVYPGEFPESLFVHIVLNGSVQVVSYQAQNRKGVIGDSSKRQYFSSNDTIRLNGSLGFQPELFRLVSSPVEPSSDANSDAASTSNVSTTIQRTLRRASRMVGQPTLVVTRTELCRAPYVCCATEALGMEPFRLATVTAEAAAPTFKGELACDTRVTLTMRIRAKDLHDALISLAWGGGKSGKGSVVATEATRQTPALAEYIAAARVRAISRHYPLNEILMRQSWLLQDTPAHTIRVLVTHLTPHSYFPGEVILCPHSQNRHLCFLRRGTMTIEEAPASDARRGESCLCGRSSSRRKVLQEVPVGASFGELSVLFGEPRQFVLRAHTCCDVWCLSRQSFAATMKRDDVLRQNLLSKAAALRMRWLGEQRFTASLAQVLRKSCELFRDAPESLIRLVQERIEPVVYPPGRLLTSTSARCEEMLIILQGGVTSIVDGVAEYGPGGVIGEAIIFLHRWPMGLVSKSMVEGWKMSRNNLLDALRRIEILRRHSGEIGAHAPQLMQQVFAPPVPPCEVDAVGRSRMPLVGPPPRGATYLEYAHWLAELQLKTLCFRYRDYVKWSDISYATSSLERKKRPSTAGVPPAYESTAPESENRRQALVVGSGANVPRRMKKDATTQDSQKQQRKQKKKRKVVSGSTIPFYVNLDIVHQPFTQSYLRRLPVATRDTEEPLLARQRALTGGVNMQFRHAPRPHLERLKALLDARDKLQRVEAKQHELTEVQHERPDTLNVDRFGNPAPVHIFLQGNKPRVEITVEEAITVGYVLQFPDVKNIQSCVSSVDSDVTMGLPQHRQRRRDMAFTPNMRHYRRCFLFAASQLSEKSAEEALVQEAATRDADSQEKAHHLTTLLMAELAAKGRLSTAKTTVSAGGDVDAPLDWHKVANLGSPSQGVMSTSENSIPSMQPLSLRKGVDEADFIRQLCDNPERTMNNLRTKFHLPPLTADAEAPENCAAPPSFDTTTTTTANTNVPSKPRRGDLLGHLRALSQTPDTAIQNLACDKSLPRPSSFCNHVEMLNKTTDGGENPTTVFMERDDSPLFVDGYGQLGQAHGAQTTGVRPLQGADLSVSNSAVLWGDAGGGLAGRKRDGKSALAPRNFVMPSVSEATTTMRCMQRDVEGLNAVANEQRRERLSGAFRPAERKDPFCVDGPLPLEYQRVVDDWITDYAECARDPLYASKIPSLLMLEAGADYLMEEFQNMRRQQLEAVKNVRGVEMWRGEVDAKERRDGRSRDEPRAQADRGIFATIGPKKLGQVSKPLRNPMSDLSPEEYQQWLAKRDAMFANATRSA